MKPQCNVQGSNIQKGLTNVNQPLKTNYFGPDLCVCLCVREKEKVTVGHKEIPLLSEIGSQD